MAWYGFLVPDNLAQGIKMGLHVAADAASFAPPPFHLIGTACEAGACVAGMCDPHSTKEAEAAEFALRGSLSLIPASGLVKTSIKVSRIAVREVLSPAVNIGTNYFSGKYSELEADKALELFDKSFNEALKAAGVDPASLTPESRKEALKGFYDKMQQNGSAVVDKNGQKLSADDFLKYDETKHPAKPAPAGNKIIPERQILETTEKSYRINAGLNESTPLTESQQEEVKETFLKAKQNMKDQGYTIIDDKGDLAMREALSPSLSLRDDKSLALNVPLAAQLKKSELHL